MNRRRVSQRQLPFPGEELSEQIAAVDLQQTRRLLALLLSEVVTADFPASEVLDEREDPIQPS